VDLRDVPLGTYFLFFLNQDAHGNFTRLATMEDQYTMDANHGFSYKLDEADLAAGMLKLTKQNLAKNQPDAGHQELLVGSDTRVWKGEQQIKLTDLEAGDELLFTLHGKDAQGRGRCADLFVGAETHKLTTQREREKHIAFIKPRGLPGWIDQVEGKKLTVTLFSGDPQTSSRVIWTPSPSGKMCLRRSPMMNSGPMTRVRRDSLPIAGGPERAGGMLWQQRSDARAGSEASP